MIFVNDWFREESLFSYYEDVLVYVEHGNAKDWKIVNAIEKPESRTRLNWDVIVNSVFS